MKTITVKGNGSLSIKPDYITISLTIEGRDKEYEKATMLVNDKVKKLQDGVIDAGFKKEDLKTINFNVNTLYESILDNKGNYKNEFTGYSCMYYMNLAFDFNNEVLTKTLSTIANSDVEPQLNICFTIKDSNVVDEQLLISATKNAKEKAIILCEASNVKLGELQSIEYNWGQHNLISNTCLNMDKSVSSIMARSKFVIPEVEPDAIDIKDSATFVWEII